jgi:hypothetical protein
MEKKYLNTIVLKEVITIPETTRDYHDNWKKCTLLDFMKI